MPPIILSRNQSFKLADWLRANWETIDAKKLSKDAAAELAEAELKFTITARSVSGVTKDLEREWPKPAKGNRHMPSGDQIIDRPRLLAGQLVEIGEVVLGLAKSIGYTGTDKIDLDLIRGIKNADTKKVRKIIAIPQQ